MATQQSLTADLSFVLDKLTEVDGSPKDSAPFAGRIDLSKLGALGHSDRGTASAV